MGVSEIVDSLKGSLNDDGGGNYIQLHEGLTFVKTLSDSLSGILIVLILVGIPLIVALEVCYINLPILRLSLEKLTEKSKSIDKIIGLCFRDAITAITKANTKETGKSANYIYLCIKMKTVLVAILIIAIVSGAINSIIGLIVKWVSGLL